MTYDVVLVDPSPLDLSTPCVMTTKIQYNGYGLHRKIWIDAYGMPPHGMDVMHMCNHKWCDNLLHLKLGTRSENLQMRTIEAAGAGGRAVRGVHKQPEHGAKQRIAQFTSRWRRCECGMETNAGSMGRHQNATGHRMAT